METWPSWRPTTHLPRPCFSLNYELFHVVSELSSRRADGGKIDHDSIAFCRFGVAVTAAQGGELTWAVPAVHSRFLRFIGVSTKGKQRGPPNSLEIAELSSFFGDSPFSSNTGSQGATRTHLLYYMPGFHRGAGELSAIFVAQQQWRTDNDATCWWFRNLPLAPVKFASLSH